MRKRFEIHAIALLLLAALALVGVMTLRTHNAVTSHRAMAEGVLRDYATLVGDEALRRIAVRVGLYGYRQGIRDLRLGLENDPDSVPAPPRREAADGTEPAPTSGELMARTFLWDESSGLLGTPSETPWIDRWLSEVLTERAGSSKPVEDFEVFHRDIDNEPVSAVVGPDGSGTRWVGFIVDRPALARWCELALAENLLPPTLSDGEVGNEVLFVRVLDARGRELYSLGARDPGAQAVERSFPDDYLQILDGLKVEAGIRTDAAPQLVIGGLPRSELPSLLAMLGLVGGLLSAAVILLRRERELVQLRSDFISRVSHELRTPLAQIRMFAETLRLDRVRNPEERSRALEIMDRESRRLSTLVDNILLFSRSDHGRGRPAGAQLAPRQIDLPAMLERLTDELAALARARRSTLVVDAADPATVHADEDALRQVLINLIDNALKYGPEGQTVTVGARSADPVVHLFVDDEGPGVPEGQREAVWRPFQRADETTGATSGTGIGLAVVRELVDLHGGRCWFESAPDSSSNRSREESGARVVVELPARVVVELPARVAADGAEVGA